jgi:uncharacterized membrane protein YGL010W
MRWWRAVAVALPGLVLAGFGVQHPTYLGVETAHHWWTMHVPLIPVFPLLAVSLLVLLRGETGPLAWAARLAGYGYAVFYVALDVLAGIGAGLVVEVEGAFGPAVPRMFEVGDRLGLIGAAMLLACSVLCTAVLGRRCGWRVLPGGLVLVVAGWVFLTSHIFYPVGVAAMVGYAVGTALLALAAPAPTGRPGAHARPA